MIVSKRLHLSLLWARRLGRIQTSLAIIVSAVMGLISRSVL